MLVGGRLGPGTHKALTSVSYGSFTSTLVEESSAQGAEHRLRVMGGRRGRKYPGPTPHKMWALVGGGDLQAFLGRAKPPPPPPRGSLRQPPTSSACRHSPPTGTTCHRCGPRAQRSKWGTEEHSPRAKDRTRATWSCRGVSQGVTLSPLLTSDKEWDPRGRTTFPTARCRRSREGQRQG